MTASFSPGLRSMDRLVCKLVAAAIVLGNTAYLERAVQALREAGKDVDERLTSRRWAGGISS